MGSNIPIHWHGHNDFGLATASAIAAVRGGASWIQGTINGMGERAGNADICEVALALQCLYNVPIEIDLAKAREVSRLVRQAGGYQVDGWKPVVGENLYVRESGAVCLDVAGVCRCDVPIQQGVDQCNVSRHVIPRSSRPSNVSTNLQPGSAIATGRRPTPSLSPG